MRTYKCDDGSDEMYSLCGGGEGGRRILSYKIFPLLYDLMSRKCVQKKKPAFSCISKSRPLNWRTNKKKKIESILPCCEKITSIHTSLQHCHVISDSYMYIYTLQHTYRTIPILYMFKRSQEEAGYTHVHTCDVSVIRYIDIY